MNKKRKIPLKIKWRAHIFIKYCILSLCLIVLACANKNEPNESGKEYASVQNKFKIIQGSGNWPSFRGEHARGSVDLQDLPDTWDGDIFVVNSGSEFKLIATNKMGELLMATPAISNGMIYVRAEHHLFAIGR